MGIVRRGANCERLFSEGNVLILAREKRSNGRQCARASRQSPRRGGHQASRKVTIFELHSAANSSLAQSQFRFECGCVPERQLGTSANQAAVSWSARENDPANGTLYM